jgi:hypothetical protein
MLPSAHVQSQDLLPNALKGRRIHIIGAGAVGAFTTLALAKMGFDAITSWDFDKVEEHNVENQLYGRTHVGMLKVQALKSLVKVLASVDIQTQPVKFQAAAPVNGSVVIITVDSITARQEIWDILKTQTPYHVIDARMGAETALLFTCNMTYESRKQYELSLHTDEESVQGRCTARTIMYTPFILGGLIADQLKRILRDEPHHDWLMADMRMFTIHHFGKDAHEYPEADALGLRAAV